MKKSLSLALVSLVLATTAMSPVYADGHAYRGNNMNGWAAAAIGAVVGVGLIAALSAPQPVYYPQAVVVSPPMVVGPGAAAYYPGQRVCQPVQVPVYDQYGRLVQYQTICAN